MRKILSICVTVVAGLALLYLSRFWPFELWPRNGVLAGLGFRPGGDLVRFWVRGTQLAQFDFLIWGIVGFITLSVLEFVTKSLR